MLQEKPVIHNKLYCDSVREKIQLTLSKITDENGHTKSVRSHHELAETANGVRMMARSLSKARIQLDVRAIMIVTKARDNSLIYLTREIVEWLLTRAKHIIIYVDSHLEHSKRFDAANLFETYTKAEQCLRFWNRGLALSQPELFDLVITLGGDGTVLYVSSMFQKVVPPVMSFSLGSLGFLTNFQFEEFREKMNDVIDAGVKACLRMRFTCRVHTSDGKLLTEQQVLNEVVIDRGPSPFVTNLELYGDGSLLTVAQADGLIIATPTGSTAYSLSAGGSLVHPGVSAISVTPICPHTLSFRPILLPDGMFLKVKVPDLLRLTAWASFDGRSRVQLNKGSYLTVHASQYPFPTVIALKTEYIDLVSRNLGWNVREKQKLFADYLSDDSRRKLHAPASGLDLFEDNPTKFDIDFSDDDGEGSLSTTTTIDDMEALALENLKLSSSAGGTDTPVSIDYNNFDDREILAHPRASICE